MKVNEKFIYLYLKEKEKYFVGGTLKNHLNEWEKITSDAAILKTVTGLDLDCEELFFQNKLKYSNQCSKYMDIMDKEIKILLGKKVITTTTQEEGEFISPIFLRPKGENQFRLIL